MSRHPFLVVVFVSSICCIAVPSERFLSSAVADQPAVSFDVPAILSVREIHVHDPPTTTQTQKTIEVIVPVTSEIRESERGNLTTFRYDVFWNRNAFPICDYGPKTQTFSEIDGTIGIDKSSEKNTALGFNLSGGYQSIVSAGSKAELGNRDGTKIHYQEIPQHEVLVASGTTRRGTGAFFRFHQSRLETLEGGHDLVLAFQVPQSWRGGVLQVECRATGTRKVLAWTEPVEIRRAFVVPIYLDTDERARQNAVDFVRREQDLRLSWQRHQQSVERENSFSFSSAIFRTGGRAKPALNLPDDWVHYLIQKDDVPLEKYRSQLPEDLAAAANGFVKSREELLKLSR